jgi:ketosteroid isomerase-like protein
MNSAPDDPVRIVHEFWRLMASNDFYSVAAVLGGDFCLEWPQSRERIRGAGNFSQMNAEYPAKGPWRFSVNRIVGQGEEAVSDVSVTDGVADARAISFFTIRGGKIVKIVEFWPEPYTPPSNRQHLTEALV